MKRLTLVLTLAGAALVFIPQHFTAAQGAADVKEFIVKTQNPDALQELVENKGLQVGPLIRYPDPSDDVLEAFGCYWIVTVPDELQSVQDRLIDGLETLSGVEYVEPNRRTEVKLDAGHGYPQGFRGNRLGMPDTFSSPYLPDDPFFPEQYGPRITGIDWAWNLSKGEGVKIAILDTGFDTDHEDLIDNFDLENAYDFVDDDTILDGGIHGTWVSGIAGARIDNGKGIAGAAGNASTLPLRVFRTSILESDLVEAITYAADKGARVISMSFGEPYYYQMTQDAIDYVWERGVFLCASAGNNNKEDELHYPSAYEHVMSVGGTDSRDERWDDGDNGSNYGEIVDVYAPADSIFSTSPDDIYRYPFFPSGTSFAVPHVASLAALLLSVHPDWTSQEVWDKIIESADTLTVDVGEVLRMNARKALDIETADFLEAEFRAYPRTGQPPLGVTFTDQSTGDPTSWSWEFGDGATSDLQDPTHTYQNEGIYTVKLTVSDGIRQNTEAKQDYINVRWGTLDAEFSADPVIGYPPFDVSFTDQSIGEIISWSWEFGDGATSDLQDPTHTYQNEGTYTVTLTVSDGTRQDTETKQDYITARRDPPEADFTATPSKAYVPLTHRLSVQFQDRSTNATFWSWDFGDGGTSEEQNPTHVYTSAGEFPVTLYVSNETSSDSKSDTVHLFVLPGQFFTETPAVACLAQNEIEIRYGTPVSTRIELSVYNVNGRLIRRVLSEEVPAGEYETLWDLCDDKGLMVGPGVYFIRGVSDSSSATQKVILLD